MNLKPEHISVSRLLLDPNNYRFLDLPGYKKITRRARYAEAGVQAHAQQILETTESFELEALKDSITSNGYVPLEQIVVEPFSGSGADQRFLVVEGNRRAAAVAALLREHAAGAANLEPSILKTLEELPAVVLDGSTDEIESYKQTLMAIRHIAGIREWGPYQQAKLIVELYDAAGNQFGTVAQKIGISTREVARRYRASKALSQMEQDEEFGEHADARLYSFFHEAVSQPKVREWLGFSDETYTITDEDARRFFYELLSPREIDGVTHPPKLSNANRQVRQLKDIVDKSGPLSILLDPECTFEEAVRAAEREDVGDETGKLSRCIIQALKLLKEPTIEAWLKKGPDDVKVWTDFVSLVDQIRPLMK